MLYSRNFLRRLVHMKTALITGITGQDGFYLSQLLLKKGYRVFGLTQTQTAVTTDEQVTLISGDISNEFDVRTAVEQCMPDEIYNLASQSSPGASWSLASKTLSVNGLGALYLFDAVLNLCPKARVFQASSSELFGQAFIPQNEETPFSPRNPYAAAKVYAHQMALIYREQYQLFISNGILFNHESEHRPLHFVTQKIAFGAACASLGIINSSKKNELGQPIVSQGKLSLGNLQVARDWGYAEDYVLAMWLMLQYPKADDFVIGTGKLHTLEQLCDLAYQHVGKNWQEHVISDKTLYRPAEITQTVADASKAHRLLAWQPAVCFQEMVGKMVDFQINYLQKTMS